MLRYRERNRVFGICLVDKEIPQFLNIVYEDHRCYTAQFYLNFLADQAY